jgi:hypothetical protein
MRSALSSFAVLLASFLSLSAHAFSVKDHEVLTRSALDAVRASNNLPQLEAHRALIVEGSRSEDLNLHVKWVGWHHFHRPGETTELPLRRPSSERVRVLWQEAEEAASHGDLARAFNRVGHLAHHIQDMAAPLHVVPVMHGLNDHFEGYETQRALQRLARREVAPLSGEDAQRVLAEETLAVVRAGLLNAKGGTIPWSAFWAEPTAPGTFGKYGEAGNAFGDTVVRFKGRTWRVERAEYESFMEARLGAAVAYTQAFLVWATQRLTAMAEARAPLALHAMRGAPEFSLELVGGLSASPLGALPVTGARLLVPLPRAMNLAFGWTQSLGPAPLRTGGLSVALLSPPLWTARPDYAWGVDLRASVGAGLYTTAGTSRPGLPLGLRARALVAEKFTLSAEAQYQALTSNALAPNALPWAHGMSFTLGVGYAWGDR